MESGTYAAYTGLLARTQALDTAANNLANAGTTGFRAQRDYFRGLLADSTDSYNASQVGEAVNGFGVLGGNHISLTQGQLATTGNPLDVALDGSGFFAVQTRMVFAIQEMDPFVDRPPVCSRHRVEILYSMHSSVRSRFQRARCESHRMERSR